MSKEDSKVFGKRYCRMELPHSYIEKPAGGAGFWKVQEFVLDMSHFSCLLDIHPSVWSAGEYAEV